MKKSSPAVVDNLVRMESIKKLGVTHPSGVE